MMEKITIYVQQRQENGSLVSVKAEGKATDQKGTDEEVADILLEAERHGNDGKSRVHISMS